MRILRPVIDQIEASVLGSGILHADDTPIRVLAPERQAKGIGKGVMRGKREITPTAQSPLSRPQPQ